MNIEVFIKGFEFLKKHWKVDEEVAERYFDVLETISDEAFPIVCQKAFVECNFLPAPRFFLDAALEAEADLAKQRRIEQGDPPKYRIWESDEEEREWVKQQRLAKIPNWTPEQKANRDAFIQNMLDDVRLKRLEAGERYKRIDYFHRKFYNSATWLPLDSNVDPSNVLKSS